MKIKREGKFLTGLGQKPFQFIHVVQEVHCSNNVVDIWSVEWGYKILFSSFSSAKRRIAILFSNNFSFKAKKTYADTKGRFVTRDIEIEDKFIKLANLYASNENEAMFFFKISLTTFLF